MTVNVTVEFSGGLELLFNKRRKIAVTLPGASGDSQDAGKDASPSSSIGPTIAELITFLATKEITHPDRSLDVFLSADGSVRPGILVLINETDWELEGEAAYVLQEGDVILFVSTLHGG